MLKCVHNKTAELRNSTEAAEWFVGYTFDLHLANQTLHYGHKIYNTVKGNMAPYKMSNCITVMPVSLQNYMFGHLIRV